MKPITKEWIDKAEQDYQVVTFLKESGLPVYDAICFFAVEVRYPGFAAEESDAEKCWDIATRLRSLILRALTE